MSTPENDLAYLRAEAQSLGEDILLLTNRALALPGFTDWSGSINNRHHYGKGGLLRHTTEVASLCMLNADACEHKVDTRVLWLAAMWHDVGKTLDYQPIVDHTTGEMSWISAPHHRLIHHVTRSSIMWTQAVVETGLCRDLDAAVLHCILSHHGSPQFGSPVMPKTREAWILHLCDMLSARMDDCDRLDVKAR